MSNNIKHYYGIKYPFKSESVENYFVDLNSTLNDYVRSILTHVIFTPKGQKLRDPQFGTNLIKFIFEPNDTMSIDSIKQEVSDIVRRYVNGITINDIGIMQSETDYSEIFVRVDYSLTKGIKTINDSFITKI